MTCFRLDPLRLVGHEMYYCVWCGVRVCVREGGGKRDKGRERVEVCV
jgi:hypothetical protein